MVGSPRPFALVAVALFTAGTFVPPAHAVGASTPDDWIKARDVEIAKAQSKWDQRELRHFSALKVRLYSFQHFADRNRMNFEFKVHDQTFRFPIALIKLQVPGLRYPVGVRPETSDFGAFTQVYLERDYQLTVAKPPKLIIDAGANIGLVSALFANQFPDARILSVEPMAENFALLSENVSPYPNITPLHAAVWNKSGTINLVTHDENNKFLGHWGVQVRESPVTDPNSAVRAMTIPEILKSSGFPVIDILKIDIEGAEVELFDQNAHLWLSKTNMLIIELHDRFKSGCRDAVYNAMKPFGFMAFKRAENTFFVRNNPL